MSSGYERFVGYEVQPQFEAKGAVATAYARVLVEVSYPPSKRAQMKHVFETPELRSMMPSDVGNAYVGLEAADRVRFLDGMHRLHTTVVQGITVELGKDAGGAWRIREMSLDGGVLTLTGLVKQAAAMVERGEDLAGNRRPSTSRSERLSYAIGEAIGTAVGFALIIAVIVVVLRRRRA